MTTKIETSTIEFDVGGTIYKVSRSLIYRHPETMLARLASPMWNQKVDGDSDHDDTSTTKPIFIERDGHRFRYVLDYMRDNGLVFLPNTVPLEAFLNDLAYYGFQDSPEAVSVRVGSVSAHKTGYEFLEKVETTFIYKRTATERMLKCMDLALYCFRQYKDCRSLTITTNVGKEMRETASNIIAGEKYFVDDFKRCLNDLGFDMSSIEVSLNAFKIVLEYASQYEVRQKRSEESLTTLFSPCLDLDKSPTRQIES